MRTLNDDKRWVNRVRIVLSRGKEPRTVNASPWRWVAPPPDCASDYVACLMRTYASGTGYPAAPNVSLIALLVSK